MNFGIPRELREREKRVGLGPSGAQDLVRAGHRVYLESGAGLGAGFPDTDYQKVGTEVVFTPEEAWGRADVVLKVAPPLPAEHSLLREDHVVLAFMHLVVAPKGLIHAFEERGITAIAMEGIEDEDGSLPVLTPMSEVGGRMAPVIAAQYSQSSYGGLGIVLSGVPGVPAAHVVILGGGVVGQNAARSALGLGAQVTVLDSSAKHLQRLDDLFGGRLITMVANPHNIERAVRYADVLIGAVLVPRQRAPVLVTRDMVRAMRKRAVIVDVSIDQGGCIETSRPTTHNDPVFVEEGVLHYCVPNIPGNVARTATHSLSNVLVPFLLRMGSEGLERTLLADPALAKGVNVYRGKVVDRAVGEAHGIAAGRLEELLR
jgi:alanine dehydrogenase